MSSSKTSRFVDANAAVIECRAAMEALMRADPSGYELTRLFVQTRDADNFKALLTHLPADDSASEVDSANEESDAEPTIATRKSKQKQKVMKLLQALSSDSDEPEIKIEQGAEGEVSDPFADVVFASGGGKNKRKSEGGSSNPKRKVSKLVFDKSPSPETVETPTKPGASAAKTKKKGKGKAKPKFSTTILE